MGLQKMTYIYFLFFLLFGCSSNVQKEDTNQGEQKALISQTEEVQVSLKSDKLKLLEGKITITLPLGFNVMSEEMLAAKYPASNRPTLVYTNEDGSINFAFNHTANQITEDKLPEVLPAFVQQFNSIYTQIQCKPPGMSIFSAWYMVFNFVSKNDDTNRKESSDASTGQPMGRKWAKPGQICSAK